MWNVKINFWRKIVQILFTCALIPPGVNHQIIMYFKALNCTVRVGVYWIAIKTKTRNTGEKYNTKQISLLSIICTFDEKYQMSIHTLQTFYLMSVSVGHPICSCYIRVFLMNIVQFWIFSFRLGNYSWLIGKHRVLFHYFIWLGQVYVVRIRRRGKCMMVP